MKKSVLSAIIVALLVVAGVVIYAVTKKDDSTSKSQTTVQTPTTTDTTKPTTTNNAVNTARTGTKIAIKGFAFSPSSITVKKGDTVTWTNDDSASHTVTTKGTNPQSFDSGTLANGKSFSHTFTAVGTYTYICSFHSSMIGIVTVTE